MRQAWPASWRAHSSAGGGTLGPDNWQSAGYDIRERRSLIKSKTSRYWKCEIGTPLRAPSSRRAMDERRPLVFLRHPFLLHLTEKFIDLSAEYRLPAIYQWREAVEAGGLVSNGPVLASMWRQSGVIVTKVLKGAKPTDLPIEQPTKFELLVNAKTAQSLGLTIPPNILLRADAVIE